MLLITQNCFLTIKYSKKRLVFESWDIAYFARVYYCYYYYYYFNAWHNLLQCSFMQPLWKNKIPQSSSSSYYFIMLFVSMFQLYIAYWCVSLCYSSDLPWYVKIATPTALSASALRSGIYWSVAQLLFRYNKRNQ